MCKVGKNESFGWQLLHIEGKFEFCDNKTVYALPFRFVDNGTMEELHCIEIVFKNQAIQTCLRVYYCFTMG